MSPRMLPEAGDFYLRSARFANLADYSGDVNTYAGNVTWAVSVSGPDTSVPGAQINISVLLTKVSESPSNFFYIGFGISLQNVSIYTKDGTFLAKMTNYSNAGFGPLATVPLTVPGAFPHPGDWDLVVYLKFMMYVDMRIGFLPISGVEINPVNFAVYIE